MTSTRARKPSYKDLTANPRTGVSVPGDVTRQIIALRPGTSVDLTPDDGNLAAERSRMASRIRTARLQTGHRYRTITRGQRLYVVCDLGD